MNNILAVLQDLQLDLIKQRNATIDFSGPILTEVQSYNIKEIDTELDMIDRFIDDIHFSKSLRDAMEKYAITRRIKG